MACASSSAPIWAVRPEVVSRESYRTLLKIVKIRTNGKPEPNRPVFLQISSTIRELAMSWPASRELLLAQMRALGFGYLAGNLPSLCLV